MTMACLRFFSSVLKLSVVKCTTSLSVSCHGSSTGGGGGNSGIAFGGTYMEAWQVSLIVVAIFLVVALLVALCIKRLCKKRGAGNWQEKSKDNHKDLAEWKQKYVDLEGKKKKSKTSAGRESSSSVSMSSIGKKGKK